MKPVIWTFLKEQCEHHIGANAAVLFFCCISPTASAQEDSAAISDSILAQELQQQISPVQQGSQQLPAQPAIQRSSPSTNPEMSVIGDFRVSYLSPAMRHFDAEMHEAELAARSVVDPYARADFFLSVARDPATGDFGLELEEGYLTTLDLPASLQLKAGKFLSAFGKINSMHPHALSFIDIPGMYENYFGDEGLNDEGFSLSLLVPNPLDFYQELTIEVTRGPADNLSFSRSTADRYLYLAHLRNFWDLSDNTTLELGLSGVGGANDSSYSSVVAGVDCTYKWKPVRFNTYQSVVLQVEALWSDKKMTLTERVRSWGMYALATCQLDKRIFLTGRFDYSNVPDNSAFVERAYSGTLGWLATEFQKVELQFKTMETNAGLHRSEILLRSVFVIGAHGAHSY